MTKEAPRYISVSDVTHLGELLAEVERGGTVVLTRDGLPVAVLGPPVPGIDPGLPPIVLEAPAIYTAAPDSHAQPATAMLRLVGGAAARSVLGVFVREPQRAIHQREIARRAGVGLRSAQLALERLESLGLVVSERDGNRRNYRANRTARFEALRGLLGREVGLTAAIAKALATLGDRVSWAFIFGSAAEGRDTVESDIDLVVVGDASRQELAGPIADAQRELVREIDLVLYTPKDLREKRAAGNHFVTAVIAGPRIDVIGGPDDA
jgi:predicted nucleotidyltransferase